MHIIFYLFYYQSHYDYLESLEKLPLQVREIIALTLLPGILTMGKVSYKKAVGVSIVSMFK